MKNQKMVSLDKDIVEDIKFQMDKYGFNFSEWVSNVYRKEFLDIDTKKRQIKDYKVAIKNLQNDINHIKNSGFDMEKSFTREEKRFLRDVPRRINDGKEWSALLRFFNEEFCRDFDMLRFKKTINFFVGGDKSA